MNSGHGMSAEVCLPCCTSCGKSEDEGGKLKTCTACKSVKYCNVDCQRDHRKAHKKQCKRIEKELKGAGAAAAADLAALSISSENMFEHTADEDADKDLFKPPPPKKDCPICFLDLPTKADQSCHLACCGKTICSGCCVKHIAVCNWTNQKRAVKNPPEPLIEVTCAFCREGTREELDAEILQRVQKRVALNDPNSIFYMATYYDEGKLGVPKNEDKALELYRRAAELGSALACWFLACRHRGKNHSMYIRYLKVASKGGKVDARYNLGVHEYKQRRYELAVKHWMISAAAGNDNALKGIGIAYRNKYATKEQFEKAIRAHQKAKEKMSSFERDMAEKFEEGGRDWSVFSESEFAKLSGVDERERTGALFAHFFAAVALHAEERKKHRK